MKRLITFAALALLMTASVFGQSTLRRQLDDLDVDVWTDRDDGSNYYEGDDVTIYFRASSDAYVTLYDLDTRGNINLLFPADPGDNNFVRGGEIYMIPERGEDYTLTVDGPPGNEHIQVVAAREFYPVPDWRGPVSVYDDDWGFKYDDDDEQFLARINERFFPDRGLATDNVTFYVAPKYYYQPVKNDCYGDCGRVYVDYPYGCDVYVDGVFYGVAPLYIPYFYLGRHRVTVYWGASIMYNDWIFVDAWSPYFIYTRHPYVYRYCYDRWYHNYVWDSYYSGPSRYKYKSADFYTSSKPKVKRGYEIVSNDHGNYTKSKTYVTDKVTRINKYKETYGYDSKSKVYTTSKFRGDGSGTKKQVYDSDGQGKTRNDGVYEKKGTAGDDSRGKSGSYESKGKSSGDSQGKTSGKESSGQKKSTSGSVEKKSGGGSKSSQPAVKSSGNSSGKSSSGSNSGSSGGSKKKK